MKTITLSITALALGIALGGCATTNPISGSTPGVAAGYTYQAPAQQLPSPSQFTVNIRILQKQCFNYAGCNITYQIDPHWLGPGPLYPNQPLMVIYQVNGADTGPIINNFTVDTNGNAHYQTREFVSTRTQPVTLSAKAISVNVAH